MPSVTTSVIKTPAAPVGHYGPTWRRGILTDHLDSFTQAGGRLHTSASDRLYAILSDGTALPVLCSELVPIRTEDGLIDGRCGSFVTGPEGYACAGHTAEREAWSSMIEADKVRWEQEQEALS